MSFAGASFSKRRRSTPIFRLRSFSSSIGSTTLDAEGTLLLLDGSEERRVCGRPRPQEVGFSLVELSRCCSSTTVASAWRYFTGLSWVVARLDETVVMSARPPPRSVQTSIVRDQPEERLTSKVLLSTPSISSELFP